MSAGAITKDFFSGESCYFGFLNKVVVYKVLRLMTTLCRSLKTCDSFQNMRKDKSVKIF